MCSEIQGDQHLESRVRSEIQASERFLRPPFLKRLFQVSPRRIQAYAVAGIAVLGLLERFLRVFSPDCCLVVLRVRAPLLREVCALRYVIVLTYRGPGMELPGAVKCLLQDAFAKVFPVREEVRSTSRCCRRPFAFKGSVNSTQPASSEKQTFTRRQRGVKSESTKQATVTPQLFSLVCHWSVKVTSVSSGSVPGVWVVVGFFLWSRREVCGGTPVMWQDDVTPSKSLKEEGWKHNQGVRDSGDGVPKRVSDSRDRGLRSQRASKSSRPGLSNETGE